MAENITLGSFNTLQNSSIIATLNSNNQIIENAFSDCLSIVGNLPNAMNSNLDMNSFQIINLQAPGTLDSPIRLVDLQNAVIGSFGTGIYGLLTGANNWTAVNTFTNTTQSTLISNGAVVIDGGLGVAKNLNVGGTFSVGTVVGTGVTTITINNLGGTFPTTGSDGLVLQNNTAATGAVPVQISPDIRFTGLGWNTGSSSSQEVDWIIATTPQSGGEVFGKLSVACQVAGAGYHQIANFYSASSVDQFQVGTGSRLAIMNIAGSATGTGAGAYLAVQAPGGTTVFSFGTFSAIFGGSANLNGAIFAVNPISTYINGGTASTTINTTGTAATSTTTGTLIVTGGAGISGAIYAGSIQNTPIGSTTPAAGTFTSITGSGGNFLVNTGSSGTAQFKINGTAVLDYGVTNGANWTFNTGSNLFVAGITTFSANSASSSTSTGTIRVTGGVGISGACYLGGTLGVPGTTTPIFTSIAAITTGAAAGAGTLTNAPASGNPTKWVPINDNGTTRYFPCW